MTGLHRFTFRLPVIAAAVAATAATATPAIACGADDEVVVQPRAALIQGRANAVFVDGDADHVVEMRVEDGKVTVVIDGEEIAHDRVRTDKGKVIVLDKDGNEIKSLNMFMHPGDADFVLALPGGQEGVRWRADGPMPNVMIGVHLADPGAAVRKHLRLEPGEGSMISGLFKGLPAQRAGLEQYDIIVTVEGEPVNEAGTILEVLAGAKAGDEVTLGVIQSGRRKDFTITVDAFDPARMSPDNLIGGGGMLRMGIPKLELKFAPGEEFDFKQFLVDPDNNNVFVPDAGRFRWRGGGDPELDDRLQHLNKRMEELHEMIDQLIKEARQRDP